MTQKKVVCLSFVCLSGRPLSKLLKGKPLRRKLDLRLLWMLVCAHKTFSSKNHRLLSDRREEEMKIQVLLLAVSVLLPHQECVEGIQLYSGAVPQVQSANRKQHERYLGTLCTLQSGADMRAQRV